MATKFGRVASYGQKASQTKLLGLLITWLCEKYKTLYLHSCSAYDHKAGQSSNLCGGGEGGTRLYPHLHTIPLATKLGRVVTYIGGIPPTNAHNLLATWSREK